MYGRGCPADTGGHPESGTPQKFVHGSSLLVNCYLEINFHKIIRVNHSLISLCVELFNLFKYFLKQSFSIGLLFHKTMMIDQN